MRFLIVDDSPTTRRLIITTLRSLDYNDFLEGEDGVEALKLLRSNDIDIVITDWNMPNMNGLELTKIIHSDEALKDTPIILISTRAEKNDIITAVQNKITNYIAKPFTPETLKKKLEPIIQQILSEKEASGKNIVNIDLRISQDFNPRKKIDDINLIYSVTSQKAVLETKFDNFNNLPHNFSILNKIDISKIVIQISTEVLDIDGNIVDTSNYSYFISD